MCWWFSRKQQRARFRPSNWQSSGFVSCAKMLNAASYSRVGLSDADVITPPSQFNTLDWTSLYDGVDLTRINSDAVNKCVKQDCQIAERLSEKSQKTNNHLLFYPNAFFASKRSMTSHGAKWILFYVWGVSFSSNRSVSFKRSFNSFSHFQMDACEHFCATVTIQLKKEKEIHKADSRERERRDSRRK